MTQFFERMLAKFPWVNKDTGLLVLRIGVGAIFLFTGWMKVSDLGSTVEFFADSGFAPFWAYLVTFVELLGGAAVLLGLGVYTRVAAKLLAIIMIVAIYTLRATPLMAMTPFLIFFVTFALMCTGAGKYSVMKEGSGAGMN